MQYYSLNNQSPVVDFKYAAVHGQAPDKGLYFPKEIPQLPTDLTKNIASYSKEAIGVKVMSPYVGDAIPSSVLAQIVEETINFDFPLVPISKQIASLELFHGPTLAFKDVGARFMSRCLGYFNQNKKQKTTVLVATSGDTGGAVANGFLDVDGVDVVILYPSGKVSQIQELQLTTCGANIKALEINGSFDDCQAIVKTLFLDQELNEKMTLTSANSINVARWLPQQLYYFYAYQQWMQSNDTAPVICVPSGNFGNICAGLMAYSSGLPIQHFVAATNSNDEIPKFLETGIYTPIKAVQTVSNAMDVGNPSNFVRIMEIFNQNIAALKEVLSSASIDDTRTKETIKKVFSSQNYMLDPHGAVAYAALEDYLENKHDKGFILETAHPIKFPDVIKEVLNVEVAVPDSVKYLLNKTKKSVLMEPDSDAIKEWLLAGA